jgi:hypothetical protein
MPSSTARIVQKHPGLWLGRSLRRDIAALPTGHSALDRRLPGGGWPLGALTELLTAAPGNGELSLLLPTLARLSSQGQWIIMLDPPWVPYPPTLHGHGVALERIMLIRTDSAHESLWACEQVLRDIRGGAVLAWHDAPGFAQLRRLQLAARNGLKIAFLFRSSTSARQASPSPLRLQLEPDTRGTRITVLKCQGRPLPEPIFVQRAPELPGSIQSKTMTEQTSPTRLPITRGKAARVLPVHAH